MAFKRRFLTALLYTESFQKEEVFCPAGMLKYSRFACLLAFSAHEALDSLRIFCAGSCIGVLSSSF